MAEDAPPEGEPSPVGEAPRTRPRARLSRALVHAAALMVVLAAVTQASQIVVPFLLASFLAVLSSPLARLLERPRFMNRALGVIVVLLAQLGLMAIISVVVSTSVNNLTSELPRYQRQLGQQLADLTQWLDSHGVHLTEANVRSIVDPSSVVNVTSSLLGGFAGVASSLMLMLIVSAFMLLEAPSLHDKLERIMARWLVPLQQQEEDPLEQATRQVQRYLGVKTATSLSTGALAGTYVWLWGLDLALFWGFMAFLLNYIPTLGSIIAALPPVMLGWVMLGPGPALGIFLGYLAINTIIGNILEPRMMGRTLGLSPTVILLSMVFWGWLLGPVGALLSPPLTMIVRIVCEHINEWNWVADLLGAPSRERLLDTAEMFRRRDKDSSDKDSGDKDSDDKASGAEVAEASS